MKILLVEPFWGGSHRQWATSFQAYSQHEIKIISLKGRHWKWRMHGGAVTLARKFLESNFIPDLILGTSMLDLTTFLGLTRERTSNIPTAMYFHENQLNYPWSSEDKDVTGRQDQHYCFLNYTSALAANWVFFNSCYHKEAFLGALPNFLKNFPDHKELSSVAQIEQKSSVLPLGLDLSRFDQFEVHSKNEIPIIVWNHRWEFDKAPEVFFDALFTLQNEQLDFRLVVLGEQYRKSPPIFEKAQKQLANKILHFGYAYSFEEYATWLWKSDIALTTSQQDFFGGSVVEAIYCGCYPILPNRLAYPEHIPQDKHSLHFYNDHNQLLTFLRKTLANSIATQSVKEYTCKYNWEQLIIKYDTEFKAITDLG